MKTVISHIFNEADLLPWWLKHHRALFDHGIIIDYNSTDGSMDIVREFCPEWEIIPSRNQFFDAIEVDAEVMEIEHRVSGWKMVLNTTEFFVTNQLNEICDYMLQENYWGIRFKPYCMLDIHNTDFSELNPDIPLFQQLTFGYPEELGGTNYRKRIFHRWPSGAYLPGRHQSFRKPIVETDMGMILWFGHSPWNAKIRARKLSIFPKIPQWNLSAGFGVHHHKTEEALQVDFLARKGFAFNLNSDEVFLKLSGLLIK